MTLDFPFKSIGELPETLPIAVMTCFALIFFARIYGWK
jgi:hypothetical protein